MCLGVVNARSNGVVSSSFGRLRPNLTKTLCNFAKTAVPDFHFTSIQVCPRACAVATVWGNEVGCSLARAVRQVIKYFYYKLRYANEPMPPEFPIEPSMALELLMA